MSTTTPRATVSIQSGSTQPAGSVFDTFNSTIRNGVVRGAQNIVHTWSDCAYVIKYSRYTSYVLTVLMLFIVLAVLLNFGRTTLTILSIVAIFCGAFQSYLLSRDSCMKVFGTTAS